MLARERIVVAVMRTRNTGGDIVTAPATAVLASARMRGDVQPYLADADCVLYHGDVLDVLRELPSESVDCAATSPPFYGLRSYLADEHPDKPLEIGLEESPELWRDRLVEVFRELRRVLVSTGTLWVECGDSYCSTAPGTTNAPMSKGSKTHADEWANYRPQTPPGMKPKDLIGAPWLLAFALRADGWWLRGCNIWAKPNAMPESAKDRCTTAHSYVFQLSKSARYYFDGDAISEPAAWDYWGSQSKVKVNDALAKSANWHMEADGRDEFAASQSKHPRSVWTIPTQGYPEAHFATWPEALASKIIQAACPGDGTVLDPFVGSGTTCFVARRLLRRSIGIDLNSDYLDLAARRLQQQSLFAVTD